MLIRDLDKDNVDEAVKLLNRVFPYDTEKDNLPEKFLKGSLNPLKYKKYWEKFNIAYLKYFVLIDDKSKKIIGTTGLYKRKQDDKGVVWLGWYCVAPEFREKKLGRKLLAWTIKKAKKQKNKKLRLYTTLHPNEKVAQELYKKIGFKEIEEYQDYIDSDKTIYMELKL